MMKFLFKQLVGKIWWALYGFAISDIITEYQVHKDFQRNLNCWTIITAFVDTDLSTRCINVFKCIEGCYLERLLETKKTK